MAVSELHYNIQYSGQEARITLAGKLNETAVLPGGAFEGLKKLRIDFEEISIVNSSGLRRWLLWMWNFEKGHPDLALTLTNVPSVLVRHIFTIKELIPKHALIGSFWSVYYCAACDYSTAAHISRESRAAAMKDAVQAHEEYCPKCKKMMEPDMASQQNITPKASSG